MRFFLASLALLGCVLTAGSEAQQNVVTPSTGLQFVPIAPCRLVDTRQPNGPFGGPPILSGTHRTFPVPQGQCGIPADAGAYLFNMTVIPLPQLRYLSVYPTGEDRGVTTTTNSLDGRIKGNSAIVPAGTNAAVDVYASDETNVIIDMFGYFAPPSGSALMYFPLTPCRVIDTRGPDGPLGGPSLFPLRERDFPVLQSPCIPHGVDAVAYSSECHLTAARRGQLICVSGRKARPSHFRGSSRLQMAFPCPTLPSSLGERVAVLPPWRALAAT